MAVAIPPRFDQVVTPWRAQTSQSRLLVKPGLKTEWCTSPHSAGRSVAMMALPWVRDRPV